MKRCSTIFLKIAVFLGSSILGLFIFGLPWLMSSMAEVIPVTAYLQYPGLIALHAAAIPFLFALYQTLKLLSNINKDKAFSQISVKALKNIKYSAITIGALYVIGMPLIVLMGDADDAPGVVLFGLIVILAGIMSAFFATVFEKRCHRNKIS